jgi:hypothetical protein
MRKLVLPISFCLAVVLGTLALPAAEIPSAAPTLAPAASQEATTITTILLSPQPLPAFMVPAAPATGCAASLLSGPKPMTLTGCGECIKRSQCPACQPGCVKDCDGFSCCVCYCS